ncbi:MAG: cytochrome c biogenesis protein CcsA [Saprospiraceae bacterium]
MRSNWWKFLGILILIYVMIAGLGFPLKPGITDISPFKVNEGEKVTFIIKGYNSNYSEKDTKAWLKLTNEEVLSAVTFDAVNDTEAAVTFNIPSSVPNNKALNYLTLVVHNNVDGPSILPSAILVKSKKSNEGSWDAWHQSSLTTLSSKPGIQFPYRSILNETIRNTYFHVPLWFSMFILLFASIIYSIKYLLSHNMRYDIISSSLVRAATLFGLLGIITGSIWAKFTWGTFWTTDVKLNMATVAMLIYMASLLLRTNIQDVDRRAKLFASYNIFAFIALIPLVIVIPRLTDSLHPGNGGNPALGGEDMENTMRLVFYPAIIGFTLLGLWIASTLMRYETIKEKWMSK